MIYYMASNIIAAFLLPLILYKTTQRVTVLDIFGSMILGFFIWPMIAIFYLFVWMERTNVKP